MELIAGVLYTSPRPTQDPDEAISILDRVLQLHVHQHDRGGRVYQPRAAIWSTDRTYLEPDLCYLSSATRRKLRGEDRNRADLVVKVLSPGSSVYDPTAKADTYAALGARELWLVDTQRKSVEVRILNGDRFAPGVVYRGRKKIVSEVLPKLELIASAVFAR